MATNAHRKLSRKTLKQPDEFVTTLDRIGDFLANNLLRLIFAAAALVGVIAIAAALSLYSQHQQRVISDQFYNALNALGDKNYKTAEQGFSALAGGSSGYPLGRLARFYLATAYLAQNQPARARDELRAYLADDSNDLFRPMVLTQLGVAYEDLGDYRNAHAAYTEAAQSRGPASSRAQLGAARTLALMGDRAGAIAVYREFLKENPYSEQTAEVIEALAQMGAAPEPAVPAHAKISTRFPRPQ